MATTFSSAKVGLDEIAARIQQNRQRMSQAKALPTTAESDLTTLEAQYTQLVVDINAAAQAAPGDAAWAAVKAETDKLVAEFMELKTNATELKEAVDLIEF